MRPAACAMVGELIVLNQFLQLWRRLLFYLRRDRFDCELEEEMRLHLEMKAEENLVAGISPEEARYAAQRQFCVAFSTV
jgi:hypothetical protein